MGRLRGDGRQRLQKVISQAGFASRRRAEELIQTGRVRVNGQVAALGCKVDPECDLIEVDGQPLTSASHRIYVLLNKPAGFLCTRYDPQGRPRVVDLVPVDERIYPVGRLDMDTEGLLLLTNDGELTHLLTHPSFGVPKTYQAWVSGVPGQAAIKQLRQGVVLEDGLTAPARVNTLRRAPDGALVEITIHEGRNRQIRRMLEAVGHPVRSLRRTGFGHLTLRGLAAGKWRYLTANEIQELRRLAAGAANGESRKQSHCDEVYGHENGNRRSWGDRFER